MKTKRPANNKARSKAKSAKAQSSKEYAFVDATKPLTIHVTAEDMEGAVPGDGYNCVISRAARREHNCFDVAVFRTVAYVRKSERSVPTRYQITLSVHDTLVAFDASGRKRPIKVTLMPPRNAIRGDTLRSNHRKAIHKKSREKAKLREQRLSAGHMKERLRRNYTKVDPLTLLGVRNGQGKRPPGNRRLGL